MAIGDATDKAPMQLGGRIELLEFSVPQNAAKAFCFFIISLKRQDSCLRYLPSARTGR